MKEYLKPEAEYISLVAEEPITDDELLEGDLGMKSSIFG